MVANDMISSSAWRCEGISWKASNLGGKKKSISNIIGRQLSKCHVGWKWSTSYIDMWKVNSNIVCTTKGLALLEQKIQVIDQ